MLQQFWHNQKGLSLVEVIVAMVLITTIGAALSGVYFTGINANVSSQQRLEGLKIAQNQLEEIRAARDANLFDDKTSLENWLSGRTAPDNWEVEFDVDKENILFQITVRVWPEGESSNPKKLSTKLLITEN